MTASTSDTDALLDQASQGDDAARQQLLVRHRARLRQMIQVRIVDGFANGQTSSSPLAVARVKASGQLDGTFGTAGFAVVGLQNVLDTQMVIQPNDAVLATVHGPDSFNGAMSAMRLTPNGVLDTTFGSGGLATAESTTNNYTAIALQADGKVVLAGDSATSANTFALARLQGDPTAPAPSFSVSVPANTTAGAAISVTVSALDASGNVLTGYTGTVHFTSTDSSATLPADYTFTSADQGVHTFTVTLTKAGSQTIAALDNADNLSGAGSLTVAPAAAMHFVISAPTSVTSGKSFSITVTALDPYGNVATGYTGTVHFTSTDSTATLPKNYTFSAADAGVHTFSGAVLKKKGTQTLTVTDTLNGTLTGSDSLTVN